MNNKVLIKLYVPELGNSFDVFIPVNELIWKIKKLLTRAISDLTGGTLNVSDNYILINKNTNDIYDNNKIVIDTNIRNASELIMLKIK